MNRFILFYLISTGFNRFKLFLKHWYWDSFVIFWDFLLKTLSRFDRIFAIKITARHWLQPLYQDRTIVGYFLGFIFRTLRIGLATAIYLLIFSLTMSLYLIWALTPPFLIIRAFV